MTHAQQTLMNRMWDDPRFFTKMQKSVIKEKEEEEKLELSRKKKKELAKQI